MATELARAAVATVRWLGQLPLSIKRTAVVLAAVFLLVVIPPGLFIAVNCFSTRAADQGTPAEVRRVTAGIENYARPESSTYLTFPEWYIVYSTEELASFIERGRPSGFPYFGSIRQFWTSYGSVCDATKGVYAFNIGNHLMLGVIGVSFTIETGLKGTYEKSVGRLAEWLSSHDTEEDIFAYQTTAKYGRFMHTTPWYEYPFGGTLAALWRDTSLWGQHPVRKWERKMVLTLEYGLKAVYASVIGMGSQTVYEPVDLEVHAWVTNAPDTLFEDTNVRRVKDAGVESYIVTIPRYEAFTATVIGLIGTGVRFWDIAGNDRILITAIAPVEWSADTNGNAILFSNPILTDPSRQRIGVSAAVKSLHTTVLDLQNSGARIEHLYDY